MDDDEIQMIEQPAGLNVRLFNHQLASVWQMERLEREKKIRKIPRKNKKFTPEAESLVILSYKISRLISRLRILS